MRWSGLLRHLDVRGAESKALRKLLDGLVASGDVRLGQRGRYELTQPPEKVAGEVVGDVPGLLAVQTADGRLPLARGHRVRGVRAGDRVEGSRTKEGVVVRRVVAPSSELLIGALVAPLPTPHGEGSERERGFGSYAAPWVESLDPGLRGRVDLAVPPAGARDGAIVDVEVLEVGFRRVSGRVVGVRDAGNEAARATDAALAAYRIPCVWPAALEESAPRGAMEGGTPSLQRAATATKSDDRLDLREVPLVTIDGEDARDFDDAVFAERRRNGGWRLVVAIADVSHYVAHDSALDHEARRRGNSVYLPDRVVPMLPEALSNGLCSLRPDEDRLAVVCDMLVSAHGRVSRHSFARATIRSAARLTYTEVAAFLEGRGAVDSSAVATSLKALSGVRKALTAQREERGALDLESHESRVELQDGRPASVVDVERNDAHRLVEEAMIAANVATARELERLLKQDGKGPASGTRPVYRVHEPPPSDRLDALEPALRLAGVSVPPAPITPPALSAALVRAKSASSLPGWIWDILTLRSLAQARYETRRLGHFGLALSTYVHFTSPIRRYSDLLVHRILFGWRPNADAQDEVCAHISATERRAESAERMVDNWLKCALIEHRVGETFSGRIAGVTGFGLFVELDGAGVQGLLHIGSLGADYFHHVPAAMALVGERSGRRFALGDALKVVLQDVSPPTGRVDLRLAERPARSERMPRERRGRGRRRR
ncbi:MAG: VacB/RNase II family 3'-5' exoribonuclease [Gammaproteobacteria bacterium]|nr:VacB/RNase II family 3'-5' exoribonuclease [Gammaproteobacteria bacterium]